VDDGTVEGTVDDDDDDDDVVDCDVSGADDADAEVTP